MLKFFIVKKMSFASYSKSEKKTTQIILFDTFYACVHTKYELYPPLKTYAYKYSYLGIGQSKYIWSIKDEFIQIWGEQYNIRRSREHIPYSSDFRLYLDIS